LAVGSLVVIDSTFSNTPIGIDTGRGANPNPPTANSIILENVNFNNVGTPVQGPSSASVLSGVGHVNAWGEGNQYSGSGAQGTFQGFIPPNTRPASLTAGSDYYERSKPCYESVSASGFVSVKDSGAKGDGVTDDSAALNKVFSDATQSGKVVYVDAGSYLVLSTVTVPPGVKIFGEAVRCATICSICFLLTILLVSCHLIQWFVLCGSNQS
jgi:glucan 1,3-beta-glucosidase